MLKTFFKGLLMGICDAIPGVSGGTIAFITGIYYKLIESIKSFSPSFFLDLIKYGLKKDKKNLTLLKKDFKKLNVFFLFNIFIGVLIGVFISSLIIKTLLENYFLYTLSFFIGLILSSSLLIFKEIKTHKFQNKLFALVGIFLGFLISLIAPSNVVSPSSYYVFLGGFFGASAMFLPGISGAFILLVMGLYEFILNALHDIRDNFLSLFVFLIGFIFGAIMISRFVSFLFAKDKCKTLYFLLGLVIGSLSVPLGEIGRNFYLITFENWIFMVFLFLTGILLVLVIWVIEKRSKDKFIEVSE